MKIEIYHDSKYGNGAKVAEELKKTITDRGHEANVHHINDIKPKEVPTADLYIFSSPTHMGRATRATIHFVKKACIPSGARYAVFATCSAPRPDKKTGRMPSDEEFEKLQHTIPMIDEQLSERGLTKVAEMKFFVNPETMKGPLVGDWQARVQKFANDVLEVS